MSQDEIDQRRARLDEATAARLAKLRSMPIDTSRLDKALRSQLPPLQPAHAGILWRIGPLRAVAATIAILAILAAAILSTSAGPVMASPIQMAQLHEDLVSGKMEATKVTSIEEANRVLAADWPQAPGVPDLPKEHVMMCCMKSIHNKKTACVLIQAGGVPVTMVVAKAADLRTPQCPSTMHAGMIYHTQSQGDLNMVMVERDGRWICLIAKLPVEPLLSIAAGIHFSRP
jgi:hypothetical protein